MSLMGMRMERVKKQLCNQIGLTLVEMLVAVAISGILVTAIYTAYVIQQKSYVVQEQVAETQQNLRAAMLRMLDEIRQAACDPTGNADARILTATATRFRFTTDIGGDAVNANESDGDTDDANEDVEYGLSNANDANGNGIADGGGLDWSTSVSLGRQTGGAGGFQPVADLIDALEFSYVMADGTSTTAPAELDDIRAVQISLLARGGRPDPDAQFSDDSTYMTASGAVWVPGDTDGDGVRDVVDNFRRRFVVFTIYIRNQEF